MSYKSFFVAAALGGAFLTSSPPSWAHKPSPAPVLEVIINRHSGRSYDSSRSVSADQILALKEAARWAPSCYGDEPWRFIICHKETHPDAYKKVLDSLVEFNQNWAKNAPVLVVIVAHTQFKTKKTDNPWASYDTGAAAENMMLQATALGLMGHQMGGFDEEKIKQSFGIKGAYKVMSVMAVGYEEKDAPDSKEPRKRQPLESIFFDGLWQGDPA
jgi:nitroreductase